jgi:energy-coupling factor transporter ATP-binding protein EcfA2
MLPVRPVTGPLSCACSHREPRSAKIAILAHITEFVISDLATERKTLERQLHRDVNVFFGLNGSGKTSLLKILNAAMANEVSSLVTVPFGFAEVSIYAITSNQVHTRRVTKPTIDDRKQHLIWPATVGAQLRLLPPQEREPKLNWTTDPPYAGFGSGGLAHRFLPTTRLYIPPLRRTTTTPWEVEVFSEDALENAFTQSVEDVWRQYSTEILLNVRRAQEEGLADILTAILAEPVSVSTVVSRLPAEVAFRRASDFLQRQSASTSALGSVEQFIQRYESDSRIQNIVERINRIEEQIEAATATRDRFENLLRTLFNGKVILLKERTIEVRLAGDEEIGLGSLSSGEKQLLRILFEVMSAGPNAVLIDEPEISMHLDWQRQLVPAMQALNPDAQLILATHSPEIMANVNDSRILKI